MFSNCYHLICLLLCLAKSEVGVGEEVSHLSILISHHTRGGGGGVVIRNISQLMGLVPIA